MWEQQQPSEPRELAERSRCKSSRLGSAQNTRAWFLERAVLPGTRVGCSGWQVFRGLGVHQQVGEVGRVLGLGYQHLISNVSEE